MGRFRRVLLWAFMLGAGGPAVAQSLAPPSPPPIVAAAAVQSPEAARAQDAAAVAERLGVTVEEAIRHLHLQEASVPVTDAIADRFADRLTGIAVEHRPDFEIVVTLTGDAPVAEQIVDLDGSAVRVTFRTGAAVDHTGLVQAITAYQATIRASLIAPPGLGIDQRSGELVAVVSGRDVAREGAGPLAERLAALTHVPVRLRVVDQPALDMGGIQGGARVVGQVPGDTHRYLCTTGFVVTDGSRYGVATAAHCPDELTGRDADGHEQALRVRRAMGLGAIRTCRSMRARRPLAPLFFADTAKTIERPVTARAGVRATRAGDFVCHRGERTGYSCSLVELTDFAPAGDLCGGACLPTWVDGGGADLQGRRQRQSRCSSATTAYGILKGGSYRRDGSCAFYFYMSTDYLPSGWRLLTADPAGQRNRATVVA